MELPNWYLEPDNVLDKEYIHINDHICKLGEIEGDLEQLIDELYDDCETIDSNIVHELIVDLCKKLDMPIPNKDNIKL